MSRWVSGNEECRVPSIGFRGYSQLKKLPLSGYFFWFPTTELHTQTRKSNSSSAWLSPAYLLSWTVRDTVPRSARILAEHAPRSSLSQSERALLAANPSNIESSRNSLRTQHRRVIQLSSTSLEHDKPSP